MRETLLRMTQIERCAWRGMQGDPLYEAYHDSEWGVPERDPRALWEKLVLDGFQAGLSWITILRKREAFRRAFCGFDPQMVAAFGELDRARLLEDAAIVRSPAKIDAAIRGARLYLDMQARGEDFSAFLWDFVGGQPIQNVWTHDTGVPAKTAEAEAMSKALKARGFNFVGPVIVYAFMQATGMVNDHLTCCFRHEPIRHMALRS